MPLVARTIANRLLQFEAKLLEATAAALRPSEADLLSKQVACINRVQRILDWKEIEFYCMRWFRAHWPEQVLFSSKEEFRLATICCRFGQKEVNVDVWAVGGHVFSLESPVGFRGLSILGPLTIINVNVA